jgi:hypothetical protein
MVKSKNIFYGFVICVEGGEFSNPSSQQPRGKLLPPSNSSIVNSCFFFFMVEKIRGEGITSFFCFQGSTPRLCSTSLQHPKVKKT